MSDRQSSVALILWDMRTAKHNIVPRGAYIDVHGDDVLYLGPTPDRSAYFWFGPGNARWLNEYQLREAGFEFTDHREGARRGKPA